MWTISQFARMTRLSAKQLRTYDAAGLLRPARVDPETGYRYYHPRQVRTALTIAMLRGLDLPLDRISELLVADDAEAQELLEREQERLLREVAVRQRAARSLARLASGEELMPYEVTTCSVPAVELVVRRCSSSAETLHADVLALVARVERELAPPPEAPAVGLYPVDLDGKFEITLGVEAAVLGGAATPAEQRVTLPAGPVARVVHTGPYDELPLAYYPLLAWAQERGHELAGPFRERYVDDPATVPPEELRTEVSVPITDPGEPR